jgi:PIN domain nuclease of toxin-antitoxin system
LAWEIAIKHRLGKLASAGALPRPHRDPFDRMLIAQAMLDDLLMISNETAFDAYGVRRLC